VATVDWFRGVGRVPTLRVAQNTRRPLEIAVEETLRSVLAQNYQGRFEVVAVDDRSTDRTGDILARLASEQPDRMGVLRVDELPQGPRR
jgi:cellulose synthase/poly-beta-1,6-N-acetylglucosamine synthase-like glycosyltransferase